MRKTDTKRNISHIFKVERTNIIDTIIKMYGCNLSSNINVKIYHWHLVNPKKFHNVTKQLFFTNYYYRTKEIVRKSIEYYYLNHINSDKIKKI